MRKAYQFYVLLDEKDFVRLKRYTTDTGIKQGHFIGNAILEKLEKDDADHRTKEVR